MLHPLRNLFVKRILTCCLAAMLFAGGLLWLPLVRAEGTDDVKTVRVAMEDSGLLITRDEEGNAAGGYAYEYILTVAAYAGWRVEFIPRGGFSVCMGALENGTVDLFYDVSRTPEREGAILFPDEAMGTEEFYLYCLASNDDIDEADWSTLNGKTVGITDGWKQNETLAEWFREQGIKPIVKVFDSDDEKERALLSGEIDLEYEISMMANEEFAPVVKITEDEFYLVANLDREDLIKDINVALRLIGETDPFFVSNLTQTYFAKSVLNKKLSETEQLWVENRGILRVGCMENYLPYSDANDAGEAGGIVAETVPLLMETLGLGDRIQVTYVPFSDNTEMFNALGRGEIDIVFPINGSIAFATENGLILTKEVLSLSVDLIYREEYTKETTARIAVNRNNSIQRNYAAENFPQGKIVLYGSDEECMQSVLDGKTGCTVFTGLRSAKLIASMKTDALETARLNKPIGLAFAVKEGNVALIALMNRAIAGTDTTAVYKLAVNQFVAAEKEETFFSFVRQHRKEILAIAFGLLLFLAGAATLVAIIAVRSRAKMKKIRTLDEKLAEKYDGIYTVDLKRNEIESVQPSKASQIGSFKGKAAYDTTVKRYAETVEPHDREEWLRLADADYIGQYMANAEYREYLYDLPGGENNKRRLMIDVLERENGEASKLLLSFSPVDKDTARSIELRERLAEHSALSKYFLEPYEAVFYVNLLDESWQCLKEEDKLAEKYPVGERYTEAFNAYIQSSVEREDRDAVSVLTNREKLKSKLAETPSFSFVFRRTETERPMYIRCEVCRGADEEHVACGFKDITKQVAREREQEVTASLAKQQRVLKSFGSMVNAALWSITADENDDIASVIWSDEMRVMLGFEPSEEDFPNTYEAWTSRLHPDDAERVDAALKQSVKGRNADENPYDVEYRLMKKDGAYRWYRAAGSFENNADNTRTMYGILYDISADRQLAEQQHKLRAALDDAMNEKRRTDALMSLNNAVKWVFPIGEDDTLEPVDYKEGSMDAYGIADPKNPFNWLDYVHPAEREHARAVLMEAASDRTGKMECNLFFRTLMPDGSYHHLQSVGKVYFRADGGRELCGMTVDVTDRIREEERMRQQLEEALEGAQAANRAKTAFLFNMSHDIRTPMNAILGFTDMAEKNIGDDEKVADCLTKTRQAGNLLLSLINSVLEMSRIESGRAELNEKPGRVDYSFAGIETSMRELAARKQIDLSFAFGQIDDNFVYADIDRANRVLINLVSNAIKYTPEGGSVRVRCEQTGRKDGRGIYRYTIEDNGVGMSEEFQKHLYEEFARENSTTATGVEGSGLGLAVTKSFVELMGGTVTCQSKQGVGTTFTVTLSLRLQDATEVARYMDPLTLETVEDGAPQEAFTLAGKRVLLVEDNEMNREIGLFILEDEGIVAEQACDGAEAVELIKEKGPAYYDAILMDIQMPVMDGYAATRAIRAMFPDAGIPIVAVSANAFSEDREASLAAGMNDHIAKPINREQLFDALGRLM